MNLLLSVIPHKAIANTYELVLENRLLLLTINNNEL